MSFRYTQTYLAFAVGKARENATKRSFAFTFKIDHTGKEEPTSCKKLNYNNNYRSKTQEHPKTERKKTAKKRLGKMTVLFRDTYGNLMRVCVRTLCV